MNIVSIVGAVATFLLTELFRRNPKLKEHTPLVVTILGAIIGIVQAAFTATTVQAAGAAVDSVAVVEVHGPTEFGFRSVLNIAGAVLINEAHTWLRYALRKLFRVR